MQIVFCGSFWLLQRPSSVSCPLRGRIQLPLGEALKAATQKRLAMTDQNTMSGRHSMGVFTLPALTCHGLHYFRCFLIALLSRCPAYILWGFLHYLQYLHCFFDSASSLFECKNSFIKVRGLLCGYSRRQAIYGSFSTISAISAVF